MLFSPTVCSLWMPPIVCFCYDCCTIGQKSTNLIFGYYGFSKLRFKKWPLGALCEPLSCILHGWKRLQMVHAPQPDSKIVIMGAGIIGNLWMCLLHHYGFRDVIVSEPSSIRRQLAEQLGKD